MKARRMLFLPTLAIAGLGLLAAACGGAETNTQGGDQRTVPAVLGEGQYIENSSEFVEAANWDAATTVGVELGEMYFTPDTLTFEAGKPYKLEVVNAGEVKHEFVAEDFFRSAAFRKAEDSSAEVKVPFFTEIEVFAGGSLELLFVPIMPGTYLLVCEIEGHREAGMEGTITVTAT